MCARVDIVTSYSGSWFLTTWLMGGAPRVLEELE